MRAGKPSLWAPATALGTSIALLVPLASAAGPSAGELRSQAAGLAAKSRSALLDLYSLNSSLDRANATLADLQGRRARLRRERAVTRLQLGIAQRAFRLSQQQLAQRLRVLYQQDQVDPLEIVLGAGSLDEAMTGIDGLDRLASQNESVIEQTAETRSSLTTLSSALAAHEAELARLTTSAQQTAATLAQDREARSAYLAGLAAQQRLTAAQIGALDAQAHAVEAKAAELTIRQGTPPGVVDPPGDPAGVPPAPAGGGTTITVSATGYSLIGRTATGIPTGWGVIAVDPSVIPLGTKLTIPGYGEGVAADTGSAVRGPTIDLWFPSTAQALAWGRRAVTITIH